MFVDASAMVAILTDEAGRDALGERIDRAWRATTSPWAIFGTVAAIVRKKKIAVARAEDLVVRFLQQAKIEVLTIDAASAAVAPIPLDRYGKGRGHRAQLNVCDCFASAMAKQHRVPLLCKGEDFSFTDIA